MSPFRVKKIWWKHLLPFSLSLHLSLSLSFSLHPTISFSRLLSPSISYSLHLYLSLLSSLHISQFSLSFFFTHSLNFLSAFSLLLPLFLWLIRTLLFLFSSLSLFPALALPFVFLLWGVDVESSIANCHHFSGNQFPNNNGEKQVASMVLIGKATTELKAQLETICNWIPKDGNYNLRFLTMAFFLWW